MIIVIADDITGAAEIAGIAHSHDLRTLFHIAMPYTEISGVGVGSVPAHAPDVIVIATDTRSMTEAEAVAETYRVMVNLKPQISNLKPQIFKKTDSALRGHIIAELHALMAATGYRHALFLPANPSKGRIIKDGTYYIDGTPLADTDFSFDPEFPACTSVLAERFPDAAACGIAMPDATTQKEIANIVRHTDAATLLAGAADLFEALLTEFDKQYSLQAEFDKHLPLLTPNSQSLLLCGSTQSHPEALGIVTSPMPLAVYDGSSDLTAWLRDALPHYAAGESLALTIPHRHRTGKAAAVHLRTVMADMAGSLICHHKPQQLIIEGGATAYATLQRSGWTSLQVVRQIAPGFVMLKAPDGTLVTMKPGSYKLYPVSI